MKKILILFTAAFAASLTGCLKDSPNVDFSGTGTLAEISSSSLVSDNSPTSGLDYFKKATLPTFLKDTGCDCYLPFDITFNVNIASEFPPTSDISVTLAVDDAKRVAYNATSSLKYEAAPDSIYTFTTKTAVVKAGSRLAKFTVTFFPGKIDPSNSYLLPISITDASGLNISGNLGTIYFHNVGNPIAGVYKWDWRRYNASDSLDPAALVSSFVANSVTMIPDDPTTIEVEDNYYNAPRFILKFTNTNGVLSNFTISQNAADVQVMNDAGITITEGPTIIKADPVNKVYEFSYAVFNGTASRYMIDKYYK